MSAVQAAAVLSLFRTIAPEFASTADDDVTALANVEIPRVSSTAFGTATTEAIACRVAHRLALQARDASATGGGAVGPVTALKTGDLGVNYGTSGFMARDAESAFYGTTNHGLRYLYLRDSRGTLPFAVLT